MQKYVSLVMYFVFLVNMCFSFYDLATLGQVNNTRAQLLFVVFMYLVVEILMVVNVTLKSNRNK